MSSRALSTWIRIGCVALITLGAVGCGGEPEGGVLDEEALASLGAKKSDQSDEAGGEYDWTTDNVPEPEGEFTSLATNAGEAKRLSACYQKLVMNCYDVHEAVRKRETEKEITGDMSAHMVKSYFAAEKDFILACIANHVGG